MTQFQQGYLEPIFIVFELLPTTANHTFSTVITKLFLQKKSLHFGFIMNFKCNTAQSRLGDVELLLAKHMLNTLIYEEPKTAHPSSKAGVLEPLLIEIFCSFCVSFFNSSLA